MHKRTWIIVAMMAMLPLACQDRAEDNEEMEDMDEGTTEMASGGAADDSMHADDPDMMVQGTGMLPEGWAVRFDRAESTLDDVAFSADNGTYHVTSGPAGVYYMDDQTLQGTYTVSADFTQLSAPEHPEAYGLFVGGTHLQEPNQQYLYFLVRQDGKYLIKTRQGDETSDVTPWTDDEAVVKAGDDGRATNSLSINVGDDAVQFMVNGTEVASIARADLVGTDGIAGIRINHNLDVEVSNFQTSGDMTM